MSKSNETKETKKRERKEKKIHTFYEIKDGVLNRKLKACPRCANFMAFHDKNRVRWTCGSCSYTEYIDQRKETQN